MESEAHRSPSQCSRALELFLYFFKIGFYTFGGGWSIVAQIQQEYVQKKGWITDEDLLDITSVGRSLPGLMIGNVSYLFGYHVAGFPGALACLLGISLPSLIVLTVVTSAHRREAFEASEFIMDWLKTEAPFWKKEVTSQGGRWVDARESDELAKNRWGE